MSLVGTEHGIDTLDKWQEWTRDKRESYFVDYPLRGMMRLQDGRYQFGYEICGYGTVVGPCCHHTHKTREGAEDCGNRFLAGEPLRRRRLIEFFRGCRS